MKHTLAHPLHPHTYKDILQFPQSSNTNNVLAIDKSEVGIFQIQIIASLAMWGDLSWHVIVECMHLNERIMRKSKDEAVCTV